MTDTDTVEQCSCPSCWRVRGVSGGGVMMWLQRLDSLSDKECRRIAYLLADAGERGEVVTPADFERWCEPVVECRRCGSMYHYDCAPCDCTACAAEQFDMCTGPGAS